MKKIPFDTLPDEEAFTLHIITGQRSDGSYYAARTSSGSFAGYPFQFSFGVNDNDVLDAVSEEMEGLHGAPRWKLIPGAALKGHMILALPNAADVYEFLCRLHRLADLGDTRAYVGSLNIRAALMLSKILAHFDCEWRDA